MKRPQKEIPKELEAVARRVLGYNPGAPPRVSASKASPQQRPPKHK